MIRNTLNYFHNKNMPVMKIEGLVFQNAVKYFGSHHYRKTHVCRVPGSFPSVKSRALGKATICRVPNNMHSANNWHSAAYLFAECQPDGTRQRHTLPSASQLTLGKERHVHRTHPQTPADDRYGGGCFCLPSAYKGTLGK